METLSVRIYEKTSTSLMEVLKCSGRISFTTKILGKNFIYIEEGLTGKRFYPNDTFEEFRPAEDYLKFELDDGSIVTIYNDISSNSLIFTFIPNKVDHLALRETVLSFIDYSYGR